MAEYRVRYDNYSVIIQNARDEKQALVIAMGDYHEFNRDKMFWPEATVEEITDLLN